MSKSGGDPCMGLLLSRGSAVQRMFLSFVSFFVRSESPFLRPDPQQRQAVARRSCQGCPQDQDCTSATSSPDYSKRSLHVVKVIALFLVVRITGMAFGWIGSTIASLISHGGARSKGNIKGKSPLKFEPVSGEVISSVGLVQ
jgi:hypothetical protein